MPLTIARGLTLASSETHAADTAVETVRLEIAGLVALMTALESSDLRDAFVRACTLIEAVKGRVIVTGMGKSGHIGRKMAATFASTGTPAMYMHPAEASHGDLGMVTPDDLLLALSWSGETRELADVISYSRRFSVPLIAITSNCDSALGSAADVCLAMPQSKEACPNELAPTTSTTVQLAMGDALAVAMITRRGFSPEDFLRFHPGGKLGAQLLTVRDLMSMGDEVPRVPSDATVRDATVEMTSKRYGVTAIVDDSDEVVGVFTDGDLRRCIGVTPLDSPVRLQATSAPITIGPQSLASEALKRMNVCKVSLLFVIDTGRLVGVLHIHEILRAGVA